MDTLERESLRRAAMDALEVLVVTHAMDDAQAALNYEAAIKAHITSQEAEIAALKTTEEMRGGQLESSRSMLSMAKAERDQWRETSDGYRFDLTTQEQRLKGAVEALEDADRRLSRPDWQVQRDKTRNILRAALVEVRRGE